MSVREKQFPLIVIVIIIIKIIYFIFLGDEIQFIRLFTKRTWECKQGVL